MNDKLKQAEELINDIADYCSYRASSDDKELLNDNKKELLSLISQLVEENERISESLYEKSLMLLILHGVDEDKAKIYVENTIRSLKNEPQKTLDELTALSQEMGDYE